MDVDQTEDVTCIKRSKELDGGDVSEPSLKKLKTDDISSTSIISQNDEKEEVIENSSPKKAQTESESINQQETDDVVASECNGAENVPTTQMDKKLEKVETSAVLNNHTSEVDVGITEYLGTHTEAFTATIKQRYSDFIVNEIDEDGNVVHLKKVTHDDKEDKDEEEEEKINEEDTSVLSEADRDAIQKIVTERNKDASHNVMAPEDKDARTKIHMAVKKNFSQLETKTAEDDEGKKVITVMWRKGKTRDSFRDEWPKSKKSCRYVRFVLYKENKDTMDAIGLIAKNLKVRENMFQYAGTKDRRAKTSQEITAHRVHPKKLVNLNKVLWNMGLGDFRYVQQPLQLGQLSGNQFIIVLRNVKACQSIVDTALTSLKDSGFINYFGMQRFGTTSVPTHNIGSALLRGDWDKAIDLILTPRNDVPAKDKFQQVWAKTKDAAATLDVTPRFCGLERNILEALNKNAKSFNALEKLSRNIRLLYVHSYQSLVWNKMVSKRLVELGQKVLPGDLVMDTKSGKSTPIVVTEETAGNYTLSDVVLPLPGHDVIYPRNQVGDWYKECLEAGGLDIGNMKRPQKDYSLPGAYRHLIIIPKDVSWTHHRYNDYTKPLTLSDFDVIQGATLEDCGPDGKLSAVILRMSLPSSCYATMALREAMRVDTSSFHQASLNEVPASS